MKLRARPQGVVYDGALLVGSSELQDLGYTVAIRVTIDSEKHLFLQPDSMDDFSIVWCTSVERKALRRYGFIRMQH